MIIKISFIPSKQYQKFSINESLYKYMKQDKIICLYVLLFHGSVPKISPNEYEKVSLVLQNRLNFQFSF